MYVICGSQEAASITLFITPKLKQIGQNVSLLIQGVCYSIGPKKGYLVANGLVLVPYSLRVIKLSGQEVIET